jgi:hypothetical protein
MLDLISNLGLFSHIPPSQASLVSINSLKTRSSAVCSSSAKREIRPPFSRRKKYGKLERVFREIGSVSWPGRTTYLPIGGLKLGKAGNFVQGLA